MANIQDIADATGYSRTTVSKAFNNYTDISAKAKKTILEAAKALDYYPNAQARGLKMRRSFTIGVILDELLGYGLAHPFFSTVIQSFRMAVEEAGYSMILISNKLGKSNIQSYTSHCTQLNVDAVFILCTDGNDPAIQELILSEIPTVLFDMPSDHTSCVISNHFQGAYDAVSHLAQLGHKRIGHIYGSQETFAGLERHRGYTKAIEDNALALRDDYCADGDYFDLEHGKQAMERLLTLDEPPTAVFISGDIMALGAIQVCDERSIRIPEDLSIIGFDNLPILDWMSPSLTTVGQDYDAIGQACCELLTNIIDKKEDQYIQKIIETNLIERKSCAPMK